MSIKYKVQLGQVTYNEAIQYYQDLKKDFLSQYSQLAQLSFKEAQQSFQQIVVNQINSSPIEDQESLVEELLKEVRTAIIEKMSNFNQNSLKHLRAKMRRLTKSKQSQAKTELQQELNMIFSEEEMYKHIIQYLSAYGDIDNNGFSVSDIMAQVKGFRDKVILNQRASAKYYQRSGKGYFREALVHEALAELTNFLDSHIISMHTGSMKNAQGQDTIYDEYIDFFNQVSQSFESHIVQNIDQGFGIQTKSWTAPWEKSGGATMWERYNIGSKQPLLHEFQTTNKSLTPINSVFFLEKKMVQALGRRQVAFISGQKFYWTCDLISEFRRINYYLAFIYDKQWKPTPSVGWQPSVNLKF